MRQDTRDQFVLSDWLREKGRWLLTPLAALLAKLGVAPNMLTVAGFLLNLPVAWALAVGRPRLAGLILIVAASFDALDGSLARHSAQTTRFGAFLDSVLDRLSEGTVFLGLAIYAIRSGDEVSQILVYAAIIGSLMVSYVRARAEGVGIACKVGLFTRFERVGVLIVGLILDQVRIVLWILAVLANLTVLQRIYHVWRLAGQVDQGKT